MKAKVINTAFLHDGKYYYQNSIIDIPPDLIKKYPGNLLAVDLFPDSEKENAKPVNNLAIEQLNNKINPEHVEGKSNPLQQGELAPSAELVPSGIVKTKNLKKNKRSKK